MSRGIKYWIGLLLGGLVVWALIAWPLPTHFGSAIPSADRMPPTEAPLNELMPGDHLQLYYHFWLARDMLAGQTPPFNNVYEFNLGDDAQRARFNPYYVPFSLIFAVLSPWLGGPAGWNLASLVSVLLGIAGCYCLARRYAPTAMLALAVALITAAFPYRWITLLGGSPTGFGMGLIPWVLVGVDLAVRDRRVTGGCVAGMALLSSYCTDLHCFYFAVLLTPIWCATAWLTTSPSQAGLPTRIRSTAIALLPAIGFSAIAIGFSVLASRHLASTDVAAGRSWNDVKLCSPILRGLLYWHPLGYSNHIYMGYALSTLLALAYGLYAVGFVRSRRRSAAAEPADRPDARTHGLLAIVTLLLIATLLLALGTEGPWDGLPLKFARRLLPKFTMIRQTPKIFCLMPSLLTVALAILASMLPTWRKASSRRCLTAAWLLLGVLTAAESAVWFRTGLCILPDGMPAYEAIARHAAGQGETKPHAVVVPLWPGDTHFSSVYEYGVIHSRVRLLNGYSPAIPEDYTQHVFKPLAGLNQGVLDDETLARLRSFSVRYLIFHEQPYPEKVSPFPSAIALRRLMQHPWLEPLAIDGAMRSFIIRDTPRAAGEIPDLWGQPRYLPTRHWMPVRQPSAGHPAFAFALTQRTPLPPAPNLRYLLRLSGGGRLVSSQGLQLEVPREPTWIEAPLTRPTGDTWQVAAGQPRLEHAAIIAGDGAGVPDAAGGYRWPAADLFHLGATDTGTGSVRIDPRRVSRGLVLWGPNLPLAPGRYRSTLLTEVLSPQDAGTSDGDFLATAMGREPLILGAAPVQPGEPVTCTFDYDGSRPLRLEYHYHRRIPVRLIAVELVRLESAVP